MNAAQLTAMANSLESKASITTPANPGEAGNWRRIAAAAEALSGTSSTANPNVAGYMLRTAKALEASAGTSGAEESATYDGLLKRIVDALEVKAGAVTTGSLYQRATVGSANAVFSFTPASLFGAGDQGAWFDASTMSTSVDAAIAQWNDSSGKANHITQATGANQPLRKSAAEGFFALFDGANDKLVSTDTDLFITGNLTIVMAVRPVVGQYNMWLTAQTALTSNVPFEFRTAPTGSVEFLSGGAGVEQDGTVATVAAGADKVISARRTVGIGVQIGIDGVEEGFAHEAVPTFDGGTVFNMGARNGDAIASANGRVYQALIINRLLTAPELAQVVTFMGAKQGRTI